MYEFDIVGVCAFSLPLSVGIIAPLIGTVSWQWERKRHRVPALSQREGKRSTIRS